ncbi:hypothetical protein JTB14_014180 [Gonioctena quinquepunctata]|nr:hypothetical protein JTB14_014180 [Gonioctena quinquepunctata]
MEKFILKKSDPSNREMLQFMTKKFAGLEKSVIFNSDVMDDLQKTLKNLNSENSRLKKEQLVLNKRISDLEHKVLDMHKKITHDEMKQKSCNIVVVGINSDNVQGDIKKSFQKLKFEIQEDDYRLQVLPSKLPNKPVLVKFHSAELRQEPLICINLRRSWIQKVGKRKGTNKRKEILLDMYGLKMGGFMQGRMRGGGID